MRNRGEIEYDEEVLSLEGKRRKIERMSWSEQ